MSPDWEAKLDALTKVKVLYEHAQEKLAYAHELAMFINRDFDASFAGLFARVSSEMALQSEIVDFLKPRLDRAQAEYDAAKAGKP